MFPSQGELQTRWGWGSPWGVWPQRYYPLRLWLEWAWPRDTKLGMDMDWGQGVILHRGHSRLSQSAGEVTLAGVSYRSYVTEVRVSQLVRWTFWLKSDGLAVI